MAFSEQQAELRDHYLDYYFGMKPSGRSTGVSFEYKSDPDLKIILPTDSSLVSEVERLRKRIYFPLHMRGTSAQYMEQAKQAGVMSVKKVDNIYEDDIGSIASYKIPTADKKIPSAEFLFLLQNTTTSALRYGFQHADWQFALNREDPKSVLVEDTFDDGVEVVTCYAKSDEQRRKEPFAKYLYMGLRENGSFSVEHEYDYTELSGYGNFRLWGKSMAPFRERSFKSREPITEHNPFYMKVTKQEVLDMIDLVNDPNSDEGVIARHMRAQITHSFDDHYALFDAVTYFIGEKLTLELLVKLKRYEHKNDHIFEKPYEEPAYQFEPMKWDL